MVVVAMEEAPFLVSMHPVVCGVKIENQFIRCFSVRGDERIEQHLVQANGHLPVNPVFQPAQRGLPAQHGIAFNASLEGKIGSQGLVIVEILIAQSEPIHPLPEQA